MRSGQHNLTHIDCHAKCALYYNFYDFILLYNDLLNTQAKEYLNCTLVMDNVSLHKSKDLRMIDILWPNMVHMYLPPPHTDPFNPIENVFQSEKYGSAR